MAMTDHARGRVAVIRRVDHDEGRVTVEYRNGDTGWFNPPAGTDIQPGSLWLIGEHGMTPAPDELWPDRSSFAVIAEILPDALIIEHQGRLERHTIQDPARYRQGNTIELDILGNITGVVSDRPLRLWGLGETGEDPIARFRRPPSTGGPGFDSFGGYTHIVQRARELIETPLRWRTQLQRIGARPVKGVLFSGPPGTGKTKLASLIANETNAVFYEVSGPAIVSKWVGDSEKALRALFEEARQQDAAIIFFDEIDSIAGHRDNDSQEFSRRVVAELLTAMDGFDPDSNIVVIGATNRITGIDPALRRPGRFDWVVEFPMPDLPDREAILQVTAKDLNTDGPLPHTTIAQRTGGWAPAELTAILTEAALLAVNDNGRDIILAEDYLGGYHRMSRRVKLAHTIEQQQTS